MPAYLYQCECGVLFEDSNPISKFKDPKSCPDCGELAARAMPDSMTGQFNLEVGGPGPQNSGVHDMDTHIDRIIGKSADQNREVHRRRVKDKKELIQSTGATGEDLSRNPDGSYRVMAPEERDVHQRALRIHTKAGQALKKSP